MTTSLVSPIVTEYRNSTFAKIWRFIWRLLPGFSSRYSPFFHFDDGTILWSQGFGSQAFLKNDRSVTISWEFGNGWPPARIVYLSKVVHWDPPHNQQQLTVEERDELTKRLQQFHKARGKNLIFD
jgi:hypothetical protein